LFKKVAFLHLTFGKTPYWTIFDYQNKTRMTTQWVFNEVSTITERNLQVLKQKIAELSENQLRWKPNDASWSILEVAAHLNEYARFYHEAFSKRIEKTRFREPKDNFVSSPLGRSAWISMKLGNARNVKRKFNAPKGYNPLLHPELVTGNDIMILIAGQQELLGIFEKATAVNIRKVKVPISISKIIRLRLGDALLFVAYHNERHIQQAINLTKLPQFPKK
jgi:DinB superfamily